MKQILKDYTIFDTESLFSEDLIFLISENIQMEEQLSNFRYDNIHHFENQFMKLQYLLHIHV